MSSASTTEIPFQKGWPLIGQTLFYQKDCHRFYQRAYQSHGEISASRLLFQPVVTLLGPDANEMVLLNRDGNFSSALAWNWMLQRLFPGGLMLRDGQDHKHHRRLMNSAFSRAALEGYISQMQPLIREGVAHWGRDQPLAFYPAMKRLTLDLATQVFMGLGHCSAANDVNRWFGELVEASVSIFRLNLPFTRYGRGIAARAKLEGYFTELLREKRGCKRQDMFSLLAQEVDEQGHRFSDQDVINHMIFLMMAAHDTTTSSLVSIAEALTDYPDWQAKVWEEMQGLSSEELTDADLSELKVTGWVLKEALRLYPPLVSIPRRTLSEVEYKGKKIPAGTMVEISPAFTHRMPEYWSDPDRFDPERFSPVRAEDKQHRFAWIPFGGGVHKCLGMHFAENQVKLVLFHLLKNARLQSVPRRQLKKQMIPITKPLDGFPVKLVSRKEL